MHIHNYNYNSKFYGIIILVLVFFNFSYCYAQQSKNFQKLPLINYKNNLLIFTDPNTKLKGIFDINKNQVVLNPKYNYIGRFKKCGYTYISHHSKYGIINSNIDIVTPMIYDDIYADCRTGLIKAARNEKYGIIDFDQNIIIDFDHDILSSLDNSPGYYISKIHDKYGIINIDNKLVIPYIYEDISEISKDLLSIELEDKLGIIKLNTYIVLNPEHDDLKFIEREKKLYIITRKNKNIEIFDEKGIKTSNILSADKFNIKNDFYLFPAIKDNKVGFIDIEGKWAIDPQYEPPDFFLFKSAFDERGFAPVQKQGKWGYIDSNNNWIIEPKFVRASPFGERKSDTAVVGVLVDGDEKIKTEALGIIDRNGNWVLKPDKKYAIEHIYSFGYKIILRSGQFLQETRSIGIMRFDGKWILPLSKKYNENMINVYEYDNILEINGGFGFDYYKNNGDKILITELICGKRVLRKNNGEIAWPHNFANNKCLD